MANLDEAFSEETGNGRLFSCLFGQRAHQTVGFGSAQDDVLAAALALR
jgi:hypothetical protein